MKAMCKTLLVTVLISLSGALFAEEGVLEVKVESGSRGYTEGELAAITGGSVTEIQKTGGGTLTSSGIASFAGTIRVVGGTFEVVAGDATGFGTTAGATIVEAGATVKFGNSNCGSNTEEFHVAGTGVGNGGALVGGGYVVLSKLVLDADAKVVMGDRAEFRKATGGFLDLQDHTLTIESNSTGANEYYFSVGEMRSVGTVVANNFRFFKVCSDIPLVDGEKGKFILRGTTSLLCASADATNRDIRWDLEWEAGSSGTTYVTQSPFNWAGDWTIGAGRAVAFDGAIVNLYGALQGSGTLQKGNSDKGEIRLHGATDGFSGDIQIRGGMVVFATTASLIDNYLTRVQFTNADNAMIAVGAKTASNPGGFTSEGIQSFFDTMHTRTTGISGVVGIYVPDGETFVTPLEFDSAKTVKTDALGRNCDWFKFGSCGAGTCVLTGPYVGAPTLNIYTYGDLRLSNPSDAPDRVNVLGKSIVRGGKVIFENAGTIDLGEASFYAEGSDGAHVPLATFSNVVFLCKSVYTPNSGNAANGKVEYLAGCVATNRLEFATDGSACAGTAAVRGGDVYVRGNDGFVGSIGQGCLLVESGRLHLNNYNYFGYRQTGIGQVFVSGGTLKTENRNINPGLGGTGVVYQTAGVIDVGAAGFALGAGESTFINEGLAHSEMDLAGGITKATDWTRMGAGVKTVAMLNLVGGSLETRGIYAEAAAEKSFRDVAFDGGTLRANDRTGALMAGGELTATVYAGGAIFDSAGHDVSLGHALVAATGKGVASVTITNTLTAGYAAPPIVCISGDGRGAAAVPVYDHASGTVTGIRVVCPGYGYTTASATLRHGGSSRAAKSVLLKVELAENTAPVKLTKRGAGTLAVAADQLPADSVVSVEEGALSGDGVTFAEYAADIAKAATGAYGSIPGWPEGATLTLTNLGTLDEQVGKYVLLAFSKTVPTAVPALSSGIEIPKGWKLRLRGDRLVLGVDRGFAIILR